MRGFFRMKFQAVLARTTTDMFKSRLKSENLVELTLDVYMTPSQYARIVETYGENEVTFTIGEETKKVGNLGATRDY